MKMYLAGKLLQRSLVDLIALAGDMELNPSCRRLTEMKESVV